MQNHNKAIVASALTAALIGGIAVNQLSGGSESSVAAPNQITQELIPSPDVVIPGVSTEPTVMPVQPTERPTSIRIPKVPTPGESLVIPRQTQSVAPKPRPVITTAAPKPKPVTTPKPVAEKPADSGEDFMNPGTLREVVANPTIGYQYSVAPFGFSLAAGAVVTDIAGNKRTLSEAIQDIQNPAFSNIKGEEKILCWTFAKGEVACFNLDDPNVSAYTFDAEGNKLEVTPGSIDKRNALRAVVTSVAEDGTAEGNIESQENQTLFSVHDPALGNN